jgi:hypothetical protein
VIEHVPALTSVTDEPETVQTELLFDANETARPLDAVAASATGPWSARVSEGCVNVIVCVFCATLVDDVAGALSLVSVVVSICVEAT